MKENKFLNLFVNSKPVIGMIHLKGINDQDVYERMKKEVEIYITSGIDGIILEDYFGTYPQLVKACEYVENQQIKIPFGVNCLNFDVLGFELAQKYHASFIQLDSVVGHVKPRDEPSEEAFLKEYRGNTTAAVLGGVRFKYQPVLSKNSVEEDLKIAMDRCDAIAVTQDKTGQETSISRIEQFKQAIGDFPLVVAAGVTLDNIEERMKIADAFIVGSYFKENRQDDGELSRQHVKEMMEKVNHLRGNK